MPIPTSYYQLLLLAKRIEMPAADIHEHHFHVLAAELGQAFAEHLDLNVATPYPHGLQLNLKFQSKNANRPHYAGFCLTDLIDLAIATGTPKACTIADKLVEATRSLGIAVADAMNVKAISSGTYDYALHVCLAPRHSAQPVPTQLHCGLDEDWHDPNAYQTPQAGLKFDFEEQIANVWACSRTSIDPEINKKLDPRIRDAITFSSRHRKFSAHAHQN